MALAWAQTSRALQSLRPQPTQPACTEQASGAGPHLPPLASHFLHSLPTSAATSCRQICWCLPMFGKPPKPRSKQQSKLVKNAVSSLENSWSSDSVRNGHKDSTETVALRAKYVVIEKKKKSSSGSYAINYTPYLGHWDNTVQSKIKCSTHLAWTHLTFANKVLWTYKCASCYE